jgi:hypothetical protein
MDPIQRAKREIDAIGTALGMKAAIGKLVADGVALHAESESEEPPPVPSNVRGRHNPQTYWTLMRLPMKDPILQYYWVPTSVAMELKQELLDNQSSHSDAGSGVDPVMDQLSGKVHLATFIEQVEAGRSGTVAGLAVKAMFPFDWKIGEVWVTSRGDRRKVVKLSRLVAKQANPKRGWTDTMLLGLLQVTFRGYGSLCAYQSYEQHWWTCHYMVATDTSYDINQLIRELDANS